MRDRVQTLDDAIAALDSTVAAEVKGVREVIDAQREQSKEASRETRRTIIVTGLFVALVALAGAWLL